MPKAYLSLGSNMGDRAGNIARAVASLRERGVRVTKESALYDTEPVEMRTQDWFVNSVIVDGTGAPCYGADFTPFGSERQFNNTCVPNYKFESKERDSETGNDDFGARYYASWVGRWESPDWSSTPAPVPYANLTNPQTLNLYMMATDDPETFADLDGHCPQCFEELEEAAPEVLETLESYSPELAKFDSAVADKFEPVDAAITNASSKAGDWIYGALTAATAYLMQKGDGNAHHPSNSDGKGQSEEKKSEPEPQPASGGSGSIYKVPGSGTKSGKPYIGRHNKPNPSKTRRAKDGRDRKQAKVVDTYNADDTKEGRQKEQQQIDQHGGIDNLDNQRNEIAPK